MTVNSQQLSALLGQITNGQAQFSDVIAFIDDNYRFKAVEFTNGTVHNAAGDNLGSCKVFGLAKLHHLDVLDTLALFAEHYQDVLATPKGDSHANIRAFKKYGWQGFYMGEQPLTDAPKVVLPD